jgi:hypothetical protein
MLPFGTETVEAVGRPARTTALAISALPGAAHEGQVRKWTGRSPRRPPPAAMGRQRQFATDMQPFTFEFVRVGIYDP